MSPVPTEHRLVIDNALAPLDRQVWRCSCGRWQRGVPAHGGFGASTTKARLAAANAAFRKHADYAARQRAGR